MSDRNDIPRPTVKRLSLYLREVERLIESGATTISSRRLGEKLGIAATQIRKDLGHFGQIGRSGIGYHAINLVSTLREVLGLNHNWRAIVVGAGNIGRALLAYPQFAPRGFHIMAAFDEDEAVAGEVFNGIPVHSMDKLEAYIGRENIQLALVAVPDGAAQTVAERLVKAGVHGILNFAPIRLHLDAAVVSVDLSRSMETLAFQVAHGTREESDGQS
ncbi:MAG: redox-sensing transcriptional repressor Rex [Phycisphaerae bacterium]|nr:redox-sensing transcriptional repressor Rex [Phycisphaerae bacterium]|tara:strand:+ start:3398 stop:4048 length:651 start_codon:yes stop_codon:yes gene_type:complete